MNVELFKSDQVSIQLRHEGNELDGQGHYHEALLKYNESLCFAESKEILSLAFADRSYAYFGLKMYQQSLNNIQLARNNNYPESAMPLLQKLEVICQKRSKLKRKTSFDPFDYFKLSYEHNKSVPSIIDGFEVQCDSKFGRKIIATRPLNPGDVISVETPFFQTLQELSSVEDGEGENKFKYCHHCLNDNLMDLIPCAGCNATMFCSESCQNNAQGYHQYECFVSAAFQKLEQYHVAHSFFKALAIVNGSITELQKLHNECLASPNRTVFDFDFSNSDDPEYQKNQLRAALSLARNEQHTKLELDMKVFTQHLRVKGIWKSAFISKFLLHLEQSVRVCKVYRHIFLPGKTGHQQVGLGHCLFGGLVNHSCYPNIAAFTVGDKMCSVVLRPIEAGEQIFESYSDSFPLQSVADRQKFLKSMSIDCDCEACQNPELFPTLTEMAEDYSDEVFDFVPEIESMNRKEILKTAQYLQEFIAKNQRQSVTAATIRYMCCLNVLAFRR